MIFDALLTLAVLVAIYGVFDWYRRSRKPNGPDDLVARSERNEYKVRAQQQRDQRCLQAEADACLSAAVVQADTGGRHLHYAIMSPNVSANELAQELCRRGYTAIPAHGLDAVELIW